LPLPHFEHPEVPQFDPPLRGERLDDRVKRPLHDFLRLELGQVRPLRDLFYDFFLRHENRPPTLGVRKQPPGQVVSSLGGIKGSVKHNDPLNRSESCRRRSAYWAIRSAVRRTATATAKPATAASAHFGFSRRHTSAVM